MKTSFDTVIHLLHMTSCGTLATHSTQLPGYPFASILPFVPDQLHRPVFLISGLAEHTKNLIADHRASFLVASPEAQNVLTGARLTLVGDVTRLDDSPDLVARYLRYYPEAEQYLGLGDFAFFQLAPKSIRHIAGFGQMSWIKEADLVNAAILSLVDEAKLIRELIGVQPSGVRLLGIDCYGFDIEQNGKRDRQRFPKTLKSTEKIGESVKRLLAAIYL